MMSIEPTLNKLHRTLVGVLRSLWFLPVSYFCLLWILGPVIAAISIALGQTDKPLGMPIDPEFRIAIASSGDGSDFRLIRLSELPDQLRNHPDTQLTIGRPSSQTADCEPQHLGDATTSCSTYKLLEEGANGDIIRVNEFLQGKPDLTSRYRVKGQTVTPLETWAPHEGLDMMLAATLSILLLIYGRIGHSRLSKLQP